MICRFVEIRQLSNAYANHPDAIAKTRKPPPKRRRPDAPDNPIRSPAAALIRPYAFAPNPPLPSQPASAAN